ncbi:MULTISPECIES: hypothetical protein [Cupriavidus]|uniref:hypothetical protein n=1 Tax=Cupriavidus sp. DF5525 TaxID=3160989 RepID=UPI0032DFCF4D
MAFNRLESRPRTLDFTRSLRAEVRDPLWMLTRQWQFGEFQGEDAASPVTSRIAYRHQPIDRVALADGGAAPFDPQAIALETYVEREPIPLVLRELVSGEVYSDTVFAVRWGKQFLKRLRAAGLDGHYPLYLGRFPLRVLPVAPPPGDPARKVEDTDAEQVRTALAGQIADGVAIVRAVQAGTHDGWLDGEPGGDKDQLKSIAAAFAQSCTAAIGRMFAQPEEAGGAAWLPNHLEYRFALAGPPEPDAAEPVLLAEQYHEGRLDWYSFDLVGGRKLPLEDDPAPAAPPEEVESFLPGPVRFKGQPRPRFWEMEESQTDFGKIETSATGLLHLMLAEFGLIYSNDWFMLPHPMPVNTLCEIRGIVVDDTFGRHTYIRPAGRAPETAWQRFALFHLTERDRRDAASRFYLVPAVGHVLESPPIERVNFMRDEMANMAWGVESIVPSQMGTGMSGNDQSRVREPAPAAAASEEAKIRYLAGSTAPRNWIPFIPVHLEDSVSEVRLQRARMAGAAPPRGRLLREPGSPYFIEEEEIPRAGIYVERSWQRARWIGGRTLTWVGRRKSAGRGEGWSELVFDRIIERTTQDA